MSRIVTKPTKWHVRPAKTQISLPSEDSDQQADLSLRWAHMPFCWFSREAVSQLNHQTVQQKNLALHPGNTHTSQNSQNLAFVIICENHFLKCPIFTSITTSLHYFCTAVAAFWLIVKMKVSIFICACT